MFQMAKNIRSFPRDVFSVLKIILDRLDILSNRVDVLERKKIIIPQSLIREMTSGMSSVNEFCDETTQFLIEQHRDITNLLNTQKKLLEQSTNTEALARIIVPAMEQSIPSIVQEQIDRLARLSETQNQKLEVLESLARAQETVFPSWNATPEGSEKIRHVLRFLAPRKAKDAKKCRVGRDYDGGYVMLDSFPSGSVAISLGINDDVSWDLAVAERGCEVFQYDHTISALPQSHERFHFYSQRITAHEEEEGILLQDVISDNAIPQNTPIILKMDIEGDEWSVFDTTSLDILERFTQIVVEFHHCEHLAEPEFRARAERVFKKLSEKFFVFHVHGNNCGNLVNVQNIILPESLEISFARKDLYSSEETDELFPQVLDMPNQKGRADFYLGCFRF
ncbi:hypothetical protein [Gluconobacter sp. OJB]|uniref:hypothetical protein n=1 Tax=Gluconobacter sp. OJB TaxID=3145196 RepID=UPI0031F7F185